ncbi:hypothetical protein DPMN_001165 [Dreissena polymorpha]|uniref:Uncharacterized protein n=1 Tax=Dreissena polymorpha TaxID=45954 RepID=A0A9D4ML74_DREPO|nr:hypothetical protein DPMN_001165 [Dreissena polymorpha]
MGSLQVKQQIGKIISALWEAYKSNCKLASLSVPYGKLTSQTANWQDYQCPMGSLIKVKQQIGKLISTLWEAYKSNCKLARLSVPYGKLKSQTANWQAYQYPMGSLQVKLQIGKLISTLWEAYKSNSKLARLSVPYGKLTSQTANWQDYQYPMGGLQVKQQIGKIISALWEAYKSNSKLARLSVPYGKLTSQTANWHNYQCPMGSSQETANWQGYAPSDPHLLVLFKINVTKYSHPKMSMNKKIMKSIKNNTKKCEELSPNFCWVTHL